MTQGVAQFGPESYRYNEAAQQSSTYYLNMNNAWRNVHWHRNGDCSTNPGVTLDCMNKITAGGQVSTFNPHSSLCSIGYSGTADITATSSGSC
ncbi:hypothetical protein BH23ACT9_BH23ACT9_30340 [soil metagenome]